MQLMVFIFVAASFAANSNCLNLQSVREGGCAQPPVDPHFNQTWVILQFQ